MYLRERGLFEKYPVEERITRIGEFGRQVAEFKLTDRVIFGLQEHLSPEEKERWRGLKHVADSCILERGNNPKAKVGDKLIKGERKYLISAVEPIGIFWTQYFVTERHDL